MAKSIRALEKHEKEAWEAWEAREEGTSKAAWEAWEAWKEAEAALKWEEFKIAAAKALMKPGEEDYLLCSGSDWEEMEKAAVEWKAAKEWTFPSEIETWEAREEALEALKAEQIDEAWNEFCTNYDLSPLCL